jgi:hypothetical protein
MRAVTVFRAAYDPREEKPEDRDRVLRYLRVGVMPTKRRKTIMRAFRAHHIRPVHLFVIAVVSISVVPLALLLFL